MKTMLRMGGLLLGLSMQLTAQYIPGQVYYGRNNYIEYYAGNAPLIIGAPHAGNITATDIADRTCGATDNDLYTYETARAIRDSFFVRTGKYPHLIVNRLRRIKLDPNRDYAEATCGDSVAGISYYEYHRFIDSAKACVLREYGKGFYNDFHGHGHAIQRIEIGYLLSSATLALSDSTLDSAAYVNASSFRHLAGIVPMRFSALLRGLKSLGNFFEEQGYPAVPSMTQPNPGTAPYFDGGYSVATHGSRDGGTIDAVLTELNMTGIRDTDANRRAFAHAYVNVLDRFIQVHYFGATDTTIYADTVISVKSGNWSSPDTWNGGVVPSSTRNAVIGSGDTVVVDVNTAQCKNLSFESATAKLSMASEAVLSVYGNFTLFSTAHVPFVAWAPGAKLRFAGDAVAQTLSGWNTSSSTAALMEVVVDKTAGKVTTSGLNIKLILGTSLEVAHGTFEIAATDDIYGRDLSGTATQPVVVVRANGTFNIVNGATQINSGTGSSGGPIGKLTVFGRSTISTTSTAKIQFGGIDIEDGGQLTFGSGFTINKLKSGVLRIKNGGTLSNSLVTVVWDSTMSLVIDPGGTFNSSSSTTPIPPVNPVINNGTIRYSRTSSGDQYIRDMEYADLRLSNGGNNKVWVPGAHRTVSGSLILDGGAALRFDTVGSANSWRVITVNGDVQLSEGSIVTGDSITIVLGPGASLSGEAAGNDLTGTLRTTRAVGTAAENFGNLGLSLQSGADDIGSVIMTRVTGPRGIAMVGGAPGIARTWIVESTFPPTAGRTITFAWHAGNDNDRDLSTAQVWRSTDSGTTWTKLGPSSDASTTRSIAVSTDAFGWFTVGTDMASTAVEHGRTSDLPSTVILGQNYPNPFNPTTVISFQLPDAGEGDLRVFDLLGREVAVLLHRTLTAGTHAVVFDASHLPTGMYLYRLQAGAVSVSRMMTLLR